MSSAQDVLYIVLGIVLCFMGYGLFRNMLPLWGFILGAWLSFLALPNILGADLAGQMAFKLGGAVVFGFIGAAIAGPLYFLIIFLSGAVLGMMIGSVLGYIVEIGGIFSIHQIFLLTQLPFPPMPQTSTQWLLLLIGGLIFGGLAINFQKFMICASSAFLGAAAVVTGFSGSMTGLAGNPTGQGALNVMIWLGLAVVGLIVQMHLAGKG